MTLMQSCCWCLTHMTQTLRPAVRNDTKQSSSDKSRRNKSRHHVNAVNHVYPSSHDQSLYPRGRLSVSTLLITSYRASVRRTTPAFPLPEPPSPVAWRSPDELEVVDVPLVHLREPARQRLQLAEVPLQGGQTLQVLAGTGGRVSQVVQVVHLLRVRVGVVAILGGDALRRWTGRVGGKSRSGRQEKWRWRRKGRGEKDLHTATKVRSYIHMLCRHSHIHIVSQKTLKCSAFSGNVCSFKSVLVPVAGQFLLLFHSV